MVVRVAFVVSCIALLAGTGCSVGTGSTSLGYASGATSPRGAANRLDGSFSTSNRTANTRLAKLQDAAPNGSYTKAPPGALADRNYSGTRLNVEKARKLINAYRRNHGLKPLKLNVLLTKAAKLHSTDLAKWDRISHFGSDGSNPWDRVKRSGYKARLAAENVGTGQATLEEVMAGWKKSPGHNKNLLLRDAEHMGIALVQSPNTEFRTFWTLVLGSRI
ncbi:MAG: CAP domain-containing protein [Hyphomicrobiaceae bacterium]